MSNTPRYRRFPRLTAGLLAAALTVNMLPLGAGAASSFEDVPSDHNFAAEISWLADRGITRGCNPPANTRFCPEDTVTRGQMAAFLVRALGLKPGKAQFSDTRGHVFQADVAALADAGITKGCNPPRNDRFCPDDYVTRGQMAAFLVRALGLPAGSAQFADTRGHVFQADVAALADAGITRGCNPPRNDRFCPDQPVTRGQMAAFLKRGLSGGSGGGNGGDSGGSGGDNGGGSGGGSGGGPTIPPNPGNLGDYDIAPARVLSVNANGELANGYIDGLAPLSTNGKQVAFATVASNLVDGDTNNTSDVFTIDLAKKLLRGVSVVKRAPMATEGSKGPALSRDGKWVAFVTGDQSITGRPGQFTEVVVANTATGARQIISRAPTGGKTDWANGNLSVTRPVGITSDGNQVVFTSQSTNLIADLDTRLATACGGSYRKDVWRVYLWTKSTNKVELITDQCDGDVHSVAISADGSKIIFVADREVKLAAADTNNLADVYVYDTSKKTFSLASVNSSGKQSTVGGDDPNSWQIHVSNTGRYVAFIADLQLAGSHSAGKFDVFLRDLTGGTTTRVAADVSTEGVSVSDDGKHVTYTTLGPKSTRIAWLWTRGAGAKRISPKSAYSANPYISGDGKVISFESTGQKRDWGRASQLYIVNRSDI